MSKKRTSKDNSPSSSSPNRPPDLGTALLIVILGGLLPVGAPPLFAQARIGAGRTVHGSLTAASSESTQRSSYADRYEFRLGGIEEVTIRMESGEFDTYLYLLSLDGTLLEADDDGGGRMNSEIQTKLGAGTYTIEATSWWVGATGAFTLSLTADSVFGLEKDVAGELTDRSGKSSQRSGYADQYGFTLGMAEAVTIRMESADFDTYLYLLSWDGTVLEEDDDSGRGMNSQIETTLRPGTYTIEATSWREETTGTFMLTLVTERPAGPR